MNKKGFIATSLIYSFFLIFCALLLSYISVYLHNKVLLTKITNEIKENLNNNKTIEEVVNNNGAGVYIKLPVYSDGVEINSGISWIAYGLTSDSKNVTLVSDDSIFRTTNYTSTTKTNLDDNYKTIRSLYLNNATYYTKKSWDSFNSITNSDIKSLFIDPSTVLLTKTCTSPKVSVVPDNYPNYDATTSSNDYEYYSGYLVYEEGTNTFERCVKSCSYCADTDTSPYTESCDSAGPKIVSDLVYTEGNVKLIGTRAVIEIPISTEIVGGDGTKSNPFIVNYYVTDGLVYHLDAKNSTGQLKNSSTTSIYDLSNKHLGSINGSISAISSTDGKAATFSNDTSTPLIMNDIVNKTSYPYGYTIEVVTNPNIGVTLKTSSTTITINNNVVITPGSSSSSITSYLSTDLTYDSIAIVFTNNSGTTTYDVYVNGTKINNVAVTGTAAISTSNTNDSLKIVSNSNISSLRVYNRALTSSEVMNNYMVDKSWVLK
jgi:hypothetical protein